MLRFTLGTLFFRLSILGIALGWIQLIRYANRCDTYLVEAQEQPTPITVTYRHDRLLLRTPDGATYQRPYDPLTLCVAILFVATLGLALTLVSPRPIRFLEALESS